MSAWFAGRLPDEWFEGEPERDRRPRRDHRRRHAAPVAEAGEDSREAEAGRIARWREETRGKRMRIADEAEERFGRKVAWGAVCGESRQLFTHLAVPVMTRLRQPERRVLDTLVESGVARSRADALGVVGPAGRAARGGVAGLAARRAHRRPGGSGVGSGIRPRLLTPVALSAFGGRVGGMGDDERMTGDQVTAELTTEGLTRLAAGARPGGHAVQDRQLRRRPRAGDEGDRGRRSGQPPPRRRPALPARRHHPDEPRRPAARPSATSGWRARSARSRRTWASRPSPGSGSSSSSRSTPGRRPRSSRSGPRCSAPRTGGTTSPTRRARSRRCGSRTPTVTTCRGNASTSTCGSRSTRPRRRIDAAVAAGGTLVSDEHAPSYVVLADPHGNKACICTSAARG